MVRVSIVSEVSFARPADTSQYAAGDAVSDSTSAPTALEFADAAQVQHGSGVILSGIAISSANLTQSPAFTLYVFDEEPTPTNDNAAWAPTDGDMVNLVAAIAFATWQTGNPGVDAAGNAVSIVTGIHCPFRTAPESGSLWGVVVELGTYTPVSGEVFTFRLGIQQD